MDDIPLLIDFATPSSILREQEPDLDASDFGNGPPGTFVVFPDGLRVSLPTDQIVFAEDSGGHARVGFGGMQLVGSEEGDLVFVGFASWCQDQLSPARSHTMRLDSQRVATVSVDGRLVWPADADRGCILTWSSGRERAPGPSTIVEGPGVVRRPAYRATRSRPRCTLVHLSRTWRPRAACQSRVPPLRTRRPDPLFRRRM